uniref:Synaptopodin 2 n=1 Tax=Echeneis naucrates TaxID=173247 RepID=A0A665XFK5_ECHNA
MGTGDYICVTLRGGAPWGFTLREGEGDTYRPLLISQVSVEEGGCAFLAGVWEGDEVVSLNGEPCADLTLLRAFALIDTSIDCLQLLLKRPIDYCESEEVKSDEREPPSDTFKSTTLHIFSPKHRAQSPRELYISGPQDKAQYAELGSETQFPKSPHLLYSQLHAPSSDDQRCQELVFEEKEVQKSCPPGDMVELQVSLSEQTLIDRASTSLGSARGIEGEPSNREAVQTIHTTTVSHCVPCPVREPLGQHGVVLSSPSVLEQVEVILQQQSASGAGRGILSVGGPGVSGSVGSQSKGEEGGEHSKGFPGSFTVSFGIPSEEVTQTEDQNSDSEGDPDRPNKHRARHARLRRSESLSEKQVKEAKSKCKRIALLLTAAPPNPNNKGVLMFKKHRQRAKKYTLVSYGTGEDEPEHSDEEDEENEEDKRETHTVEFTLVAPSDSEIDKHFLANAHSGQGVLTVNWDKGLLEIERNLNNQVEMECLPETQGKGALMFAQRRQRMEEISAEHEELRRQGIPVEGLLETEKKAVENSYMQSTTEGQVYMDVNQQQMQYHSSNVNGTVQHQTNEMQSSFSNRTAKPFSVENMAATPYSPTMSGTNQESMGQGEQIASRDERISTPAIRSGLLMDARRRNIAKPMFTFREAPKVSPNPALLHLLNRSDKKLGFETAPEEDYLSLGAEACNFLQSPRVKHKTPPPVAPKPVINPNTTQPQPPVNAWTPESQQTPISASISMVNNHPPPKPWQPQNAPQSRTQPPPPQRIHSFTIGQRSSPPINPMATVLNPSSAGSSYEMPAVKGKGADMFAKRQSRMEKYVVDSETVQANKASRSTSPAASLPTEWKYTPNVRAPPSRAYNPIQSPSYPPAATKQPPSSSPSSKAKKKGKEKQMPAPKPLNVIDVMKHQPYQLNSSLFTYGPAAPKPAAPKPECSPPNPPVENQPVAYEPLAPMEQAAPFNSANPPYYQAPQVPYQPTSSPPYLAAPSAPYQPQPASSYVAPNFSVAARPESASGGNVAAAPKPKFTAKKSSAQSLGRSYSLSPPARVASRGHKSASPSSSPKPATRASTTPPPRQTSLLEKAHKPPTPWEAASRHPLGLVDEAFRNTHQTLASNIRLAAQRKILPEPPAGWKARVSYGAQQKTGSQTWSPSQSRSQSRGPLPSFLSPTKSAISPPALHTGYRSLPRQWQSQRSVTEANMGYSVSPSENERPSGKQTYKSVFTSNTWSWRQ